MRKASFGIALAASLAFLASAPAEAALIALTSYTGRLPATSGDDQLYGWFLDATAPITVTALGVVTLPTGGPLSVSHDVGIFAVTDESLLVSGTVPARTVGTFLDGFWYTSVSPTLLPAGDYVIVMTMPEGDPDRQAVEVATETTSAPVAYVNSAFDSGSSLAYPTFEGAFAPGLFGPNFTFTGGVPEPSTWAMLLIGSRASASSAFGPVRQSQSAPDPPRNRISDGPPLRRPFSFICKQRSTMNSVSITAEVCPGRSGRRCRMTPILCPLSPTLRVASRARSSADDSVLTPAYHSHQGGLFYTVGGPGTGVRRARTPVATAERSRSPGPRSQSSSIAQVDGSGTSPVLTVNLDPTVP